MFRCGNVWALVLLVLTAGTAGAAVPQLINYQGALTNTEGVPLEGTYDLTFQIYPLSGSGHSMWSETHERVEVVGGIFNVILGETVAFPPTLFASQERWLGVTVGSDPEIAPRMRMTSVPWSLGAAFADSAGAVNWVDIRDMPAGFADGVDDVGGAGDGHSLDAADGAPTDAVFVDNDGNVGVGTITPSAKLDVRGTLTTGIDGGGFDVNLFGATAGSRVMWNTTKMALRAGLDATGGYWAPDSVGLYSTAMGMNVKATREYATAFGRDAVARGAAASALGWVAEADGEFSLALGRRVTANANYSAVIGNGGNYQLVNNTENSLVVGFNTTNPTLFVGGPDENVGVGLDDPEVRLDVSDAVRVQGRNYSSASYPTTGEGMEIVYRPSDDTGLIQVYNRDAGTWGKLYLGNSRVGIGTTNPEEQLHVVGTVKCDVLKLMGGSDIAEPFDVESDTERPVAPGLVVVIDPDHPGRLRVADHSYDRCVAGIVSGANAVNAGLVMSQAGSIADGEHPIALTGRVYCWVDADFGAVAPGDLLTTSSTPGHAMKVTDFTRAQGAVLGKAMSSLAAGRGLVLVLVTLQ